MTITEELVYVTSEDGYLLDGVKMLPSEPAPRPVAAVVWIHGNAGRFYDYPYVMIGRALADSGHPFFSVNTRGHDISTFLWHAAPGGKPMPWLSAGDLPTGGGSAWDALDEAPRDLASWIDLAAVAGEGRVVLAGHSSGAQRVVLYQAERRDPRVGGLVLASPDLVGFLPRPTLEEAEGMVAEGHGMEVIPAQPFAPWYRQSAQNVTGRHAILSHLLVGDDPTISHIDTPLLAYFGTREPGGAERTLTAIKQAAISTQVETRLVDDADHVYSGREAHVATMIGEWISRLPTPSV